MDVNRGSLSLRRVVALAVAARLAVVAVGYLFRGKLAFVDHDTGSYVDLARSIAHAGTFVRNGMPEIFRTPGYPFLLAPGALLGHVMLYGVALQIVVSCAAVVMVHRLAFELCGDRRAAGVAALLYAFEPLSIVYSMLVMAETVFGFLVVSSVYCLVRAVHTKSSRLVAAGAILLAASIYVRPIAYYLPVPVAVVLAVAAWRTGWSARRATLAAGLVVVIVAVALAPWQVRNYEEVRYPGFASVQDHNLYFYELPAVIAREEHRSYDDVRHSMGYTNDAWYFALHPEQRALPWGQVLSWQGRVAVRRLLAHPWAYAVIRFEGSLRVLANPGASEVLYALTGTYALVVSMQRMLDHGWLSMGLAMVRHQMPTLIVNALLGIVLFVWYAGIVVGVAVKPPLRRPAAWLAMLVIVYLVVVSGGAVGASRFRAPIMPLFAPFAASGVLAVVERLRSRRTEERS